MKKPLHCKQTQKLLARYDEHGIFLWCKQCKTEHYFTQTDLWYDLRKALAILAKQEPVSHITPVSE